MQSRRWVYTLNNPTAEELTLLNTFECKFNIYQLEKGENGTEHAQGYVVFDGNRRLSAVRKILERGHFEVARGRHEQCVEYCSKVETRVAGPWTRGEHGKSGQRSDLLDAAARVRAGNMRRVADELPAVFIRYWRGLAELRRRVVPPARREGCSGFVYIGGAGVGKTFRVWEEAEVRGGGLYCPIVTDSKIWFDGYDGERSILLDDFTGKGVEFTLLLRILDVYPLQVEVKGGSVAAEWDRVYITSNLDVVEWWDRAYAYGAQRAALERRFERVEYM